MKVILRNIFLEDLQHLEQTSTIETFHHHFEAICTLVAYAEPGIPEAYFAALFVRGLRTEVQAYVEDFLPFTVLGAYYLACLFVNGYSRIYQHQDENVEVVVGTVANSSLVVATGNVHDVAAEVSSVPKLQDVTSARCDEQNAVLNLILRAVDASGLDPSLCDDAAEEVAVSTRVRANRIVPCEHNDISAANFDCSSGPAPTAVNAVWVNTETAPLLGVQYNVYFRGAVRSSPIQVVQVIGHLHSRGSMVARVAPLGSNEVAGIATDTGTMSTIPLTPPATAGRVSYYVAVELGNSYLWQLNGIHSDTHNTAHTRVQATTDNVQVRDSVYTQKHLLTIIRVSTTTLQGANYYIQEGTYFPEYSFGSSRAQLAKILLSSDSDSVQIVELMRLGSLQIDYIVQFLSHTVKAILSTSQSSITKSWADSLSTGVVCATFSLVSQGEFDSPDCEPPDTTWTAAWPTMDSPMHYLLFLQNSSLITKFFATSWCAHNDCSSHGFPNQYSSHVASSAKFFLQQMRMELSQPLASADTLVIQLLHSAGFTIHIFMDSLSLGNLHPPLPLMDSWGSDILQHSSAHFNGERVGSHLAVQLQSFHAHELPYGQYFIASTASCSYNCTVLMASPSVVQFGSPNNNMVVPSILLTIFFSYEFAVNLCVLGKFGSATCLGIVWLMCCIILFTWLLLLMLKAWAGLHLSSLLMYLYLFLLV